MLFVLSTHFLVMIFNSSHYDSSEIKQCSSSDQQKKQKHVFLAYHKILQRVTERFNHYTLVSPVSLTFRLIPLIFFFLHITNEVSPCLFHYSFSRTRPACMRFSPPFFVPHSHPFPYSTQKSRLKSTWRASAPPARGSSPLDSIQS